MLRADDDSCCDLEGVDDSSCCDLEDGSDNCCSIDQSILQKIMILLKF